MEIHKYPIKDGDTLESIADELGLGSKWMYLLFIPDSIDNLKNNKD